jgi:AhpC/TSA antioxidant enzyme
VDAARDELAAMGCSILVVAQAKPEVLSRYLSRSGWHVPIVSDPERAAYRAFGLERTGWGSFFRPKVLWGYLRGMLRGYCVKKPYKGEDVLQLGGDFILDRLGRVVFAYPSTDPTDRPGIATIRDSLRLAGK